MTRSLLKPVCSPVLCSFLSLTILAVSAATQVARPPQSGLDEGRLKLIHLRLQELVDNQTIPGAVALVARRGQVAYLDAVGSQDLENQKPMRTDAIFQIMSMTKPFTGVAIMMLVEEGKLELRRSVADYLPSFANQQVEEVQNENRTLHKPATPVAVWHLMCHTSGLNGDPEGELSDNPRTMRMPLKDAVDYYGHQYLKFEPGTRWSYSNMGIATLGRIVEVLSGDDYVHFIQKRILEPLGMTDTFFFASDEKKGRIAMVYKHQDGKLVIAGDEILGGDPRKYRAGAKYPAPEFGLYSTASDLEKFYAMLLNGGIANGHRFLSRQSIETMRQVFTPDVNPSGWLGGTGYGLTFEVVNRPTGTLLLHSMGTFGHGGAFGTEGWMDPKNDLIRILMVQVSDGTGGPARAAVMQIGEAALLPWKRMRIVFEIRRPAGRRARARWLAFVPLAALAVVLAHSVAAEGSANSKDAAGEWVSLFDGRSMEHWQDPSKLDPPGDAWTIADGCLKAVPHPRITEDLVSQETYTNFELEFEWRVANGGNSGLKYRIQAFPILTPENHVAGKFENQVQAALVGRQFSRSLIKPGMRAQIYVVGFEYQTIAGNHPDALRGPLYQSGALYGMIAPVRDAMRPVAEFNQSRLVVRGNHIEHWLNGEKVVDGDLGAEAVKQLIAHRWGESSEVDKLLATQPNKACHISLQNHGDSAWFRALRIRRLP